jgi:hypothetical protein
LLLKAIRENRVLTIHSNPASQKKEYGEIGFQQEKGSIYLVFPHRLPDQQKARIIGINYLSMAEPAPKDPVALASADKRSPVTRPKKPPAKAKREPELTTFEVIIRRTATLEEVRTLTAVNEAAASEAAAKDMENKIFDARRATIRCEVMGISKKAGAGPRKQDRGAE